MVCSVKYSVACLADDMRVLYRETAVAVRASSDGNECGWPSPAMGGGSCRGEDHPRVCVCKQETDRDVATKCVKVSAGQRACQVSSVGVWISGTLKTKQEREEKVKGRAGHTTYFFDLMTASRKRWLVLSNFSGQETQVLLCDLDLDARIFVGASAPFPRGHHDDY